MVVMLFWGSKVFVVIVVVTPFTMKVMFLK
jgi:hypothetical protein